MSDKAHKANQAAASLYRSNVKRAGAPFFTKGTRDALLKILKKAGATDDAAKVVLRETEYAVALYPKAEERLTIGGAKKRIRDFIEAARLFAAAWDALGEELQYSICDDDLCKSALEAALCAELLEDDVGDAKAHDPAAYRFVLTVANLWVSAGINPAITNNVDEKTGEKMSTPFQRFTELCAPSDIGTGIIREAIRAASVGDKSADD